MGTELYSKVPNKIKNIVDFTAFKKDLKSFLLKHSFYTINEFVSFKKDKIVDVQDLCLDVITLYQFYIYILVCVYGNVALIYCL
jgi:hypothetical protein